MENDAEPIDGDVVVVVDAGAPAPEVEDSGDTIVVVAPEPASPEEGPSLVELVERIVNLERDVAELRGEVFDAGMAADEAQADASLALDVALDADAEAEDAEQAIDESIEEFAEEVEEADIVKGDDGEEHVQINDIPPASAKVHPLFRPASDWFKR